MNERAGADTTSTASSSAPYWPAGSTLAAASARSPARDAPLLTLGETCWRIEQADRASVLVDAAAYFAALRSAFIAARKQIVIVGWDVDSRTRLVPEKKPADGLPGRLLALLRALLRRNPELQVYILAWDFSMIYALERELLPSLTFSGVHPRLHFLLDNAHAVGASHHQKLVVIDDCLAFAGGVDLTIRRWDRPDHRVDDPERRDPDGQPYAPMHDIQLGFDGDAARALGELTRERWARAAAGLHSHAHGPAAISGERLWPGGLTPDFSDLPLGISRTFSGVRANDPDVHEIEALTCRALRQAERYIYIENQYLTSSAAARALVDSLARPNGPEICVVLPQLESGWLEQSSMGVLRRQVLARLRAHDPHGRLHIYYPKLPASQHGLQVHCKLLIVDDQLLKIGSANLSNRSLGLDTECDITIEALPGDRDAPRIAQGIRRMLARLLAEHLALTEAECRARLERASVREVIEARCGAERCLELLPESLPDPALDLGSLGEWVVDPERPMAGETFIEGLFPTDLRHPWLRSTLASVGMLSPVLLMAAIWQQHGAALQQLLQSDTHAWLLFAAYTVSCMLFMPLTATLAATVVILDARSAFAFGLAGALLAAMVAYGVGRRFRPVTLRWLRSRRARQLQRSARVRAFRATVIARLLPVGNFTASNLLAGALRVPFGRFLLGNLAGLGLGVATLIPFAKRVLAACEQPTAANILLCALTGAGMIALCYAVAHAFARPEAVHNESAPLPAAARASQPVAAESDR